MLSSKSTFALFIGNRGFFSSEMLHVSRETLVLTLKKFGHEIIMLDESATRFGAVETPHEGRIFADFLRQNHSKFDGVILSLPNFGDETGAVEALAECGVPILIHAFPDDLDKMGMTQRRDAFCGKFAMMNLFTQYKIPFTVMMPHAVFPDVPEFCSNIDTFDRICRVYKGMKKMNIGAFGARTTPFKAVRFDETTLQNYGISTETFDLSDIFAQVRSIKTTDVGFINKATALKKYVSWKNVPRSAFENLTRLAVVIDQAIDEYSLDAIALRCWIEIQKELDISPCIILSELNSRGIAAACELDVSSAIAMHALKLASGSPCACFDWNNNYGKASDKCIMFHCGPAPKTMMTPGGIISEHAILKETAGYCGTFGCYTGRLKNAAITYAGAVTFNGKLSFYIDEGKITDDPIPIEFFGCAGVAEVSNLQQKLKNIGSAGFRHHVAVTHGNVGTSLREAFTKYMNYNLIDI